MYIILFDLYNYITLYYWVTIFRFSYDSLVCTKLFKTKSIIYVNTFSQI